MLNTPLLCHAYSNYAQRILDSNKILASDVKALSERLPLLCADLSELFAQYSPIHHDVEFIANATLRHVRVLVLLAMMEYDLSHPPTEHSLTTITSTISALADASLMFALNVHYPMLVAIHGEPRSESTGEAMPLWVMGMGKLSGHELNVSSDMDLIFIFEHEGTTIVPKNLSANTRVRTLSHGEFFERLGKRVIKTLDDVTEHGFVFRVDMRLRPNGAAGALCMSLNALEKYLFTQARTWERFVWLKSRLINPSASAHLLEQIVHPFVFRRYLDYDAIDALRDVHNKIRHKANTQASKHPDSIDIKIGAGGIREIEFSVQLPQLIKGARLPKLQQKSTLKALPELAHAQLIPSDVAHQLREHYIFLRHLEHRIQYINDAQTQLIPSEPELRERLACSIGWGTYNELAQHLHNIQIQVSDYFNTLFERDDAGASSEHITTLDKIQDDEYANLWAIFDTPQEVLDLYIQTHSNPRLSALPERSLIRYQQLIINTAIILTRTATITPIPAEWLRRIWGFLDLISRRSSYLALLDEYPKATERLVELLIRSRWAADYLTAHPILLDELLNIEQLHQAPDWHELSMHLNELLAYHVSDVERQMDVLRDTHHAQVFRLLAQELDGLWTVEQLADHLSDLTDTMLNCALKHCWSAFNKKHRDTPELAIIAYGKLGGKEMGYASDLDLVFIYEDSDIEAGSIYARFAKRLDNWLTAPTGAGILYDTDYRLRPNGDSGLMVVSTRMFEQYQYNNAWFWEHQALTRARFCAGSPTVGAWFEKCRSKILTMPRQAQTVRTEIMSMRHKLHAGHPNSSPLFDLKHDEGGMVDIEFCVQALVLSHAQHHPELIENKGNIALLKRAETVGLIPELLGTACGNAYREYRRLQHIARLQNTPQPRVPHEQVNTHIQAVLQLKSIVLN